MEVINRTKEHILATVIILLAGIISLIFAVIKGYFGLAVQVFLGLLACSSVLLFIMPVILKGDKK